MKVISIPELINCEIRFPASFTNLEVREWGLLFHNTLNPTSHDSNHAVILNPESDLDELLVEISEFYQSRALQPRLYPSYQPGEYERLGPYLEKHGYECRQYESWLGVLSGRSRITPNRSIEISEVHRMDAGIEELLRRCEKSDRSVIILSRRLRNPGFRLYVAHVGGVAASMLAFEMYDGFTMVDNVMTRDDYQRCGLCSALVDHACGRHAEMSENVLYLWTTNPVAQRIYERAGFRSIDIGAEPWSAEFPEATQ